MKRTKHAGRNVRLPKENASYVELADFFDGNDGAELLAKGITAVAPDVSDLNQMLLQYRKERSTLQTKRRLRAIRPV